MLLTVFAELGAQQLVDSWLPNFERVDAKTSGTPDDPVSPFLGTPDRVGDELIGGRSVRFNERGMRGPPVPTPKPARVRRVLLLGSEAVFGIGVANADVFGQVAIDTLGGDRIGIETVNSARPGFSSFQSLNLLEMRGWATEPDLVVIGDNPVDWSLASTPDDERLLPFQVSGQWAQSLRWFALARILDFEMRAAQQDGTTSQAYLLKNPPLGSGSFRVGTNRFAQILDTVVDRAQANNAEIVFLITPTPNDVAFGNLPQVVEQYRAVLRDAGKRNGVPIIDGARALADARRPRNELFVDENNLSVLGHRVLGQAMARTLRPWVRGARVMTPRDGSTRPHYSEPSLEGL
jgi:hypothetical protein